MKLYIIILFLLTHLFGFGQFNTTCETSTAIFDNLTNNLIYSDTGDCETITGPLFYSFNFASAGTNHISVSPNDHSGSYTYYGPFDLLNFSTCDQISLGNIPSVSGTFVQLPGFPTGGDVFSLSNEPGIYILKIKFDQCVYNIISAGDKGLSFGITVNGENDLLSDEIDICQDCITSFSPNAGKYLVSAWVKEEGATMTTTNYTHSSIDISFSGDPSTISLAPVGRIIDGWQRIEGIITVPMSATDIHLSFETSSGTSYYDDIRFHPLDGSMMSYVYDPISLRLMAELDERNYATLYEYDEEGKLIRVKKETEKGIMTIQENRDNIRKQ